MVATQSPQSFGNGWKNFKAFRRDPLPFLEHLSLLGPVVPFALLHLPRVLVNSPRGIERVLVSNAANYDKSIEDWGVVRDLSGYGVLTSSGADHLHQRRLIQPAFHRQHLRSFASLMTQATEDMLQQRWQKTIVLQDEMRALTLNVACKTLFGTHLADADLVGGLFDEAMLGMMERLRALIPLPLSIPTHANSHFKRARRQLYAAIDHLVAERATTAHDDIDIISLLLEARDEQGNAMSYEQVRTEAVTMLGAGHGTTASMLTWLWFLLAQPQYREIEERLHAELDDVLNGRLPTVPDLPQLVYTRKIIDEVLRLYPSDWLLPRGTVADDEIDGYPVRAGTGVLISPWTVHRNPAFWTDPNRFNPDRFDPLQAAGRPKYAYLPFAHGVHKCIGYEFALMEATLVVATIAQRYHLRCALAMEDIAPSTASAILSPAGPIVMRLEPTSAHRPTRKSEVPITSRL